MPFNIHVVVTDIFLKSCNEVAYFVAKQPSFKMLSKHILACLY